MGRHDGDSGDRRLGRSRCRVLSDLPADLLQRLQILDNLHSFFF